MNIRYQNGNPKEGCHGIKVAGSGNIRFYRVILCLIVLPGSRPVGVGSCTVDAAAAIVIAGISSTVEQRSCCHAELCHHFCGHVNIGHAVFPFYLNGKIPGGKSGGNQKSA